VTLEATNINGSRRNVVAFGTPILTEHADDNKGPIEGPVVTETALKIFEEMYPRMASGPPELNKVIAKLSLSGIDSIRGTILDPNNTDGIWVEVSPTRVCLKPGIDLKEADVRRIVTGDFDRVWTVLQQTLVSPRRVFLDLNNHDKIRVDVWDAVAQEWKVQGYVVNPRYNLTIEGQEYPVISILDPQGKPVQDEIKDKKGELLAVIKKDFEGDWHYYSSQLNSEGFYPAYSFDSTTKSRGQIEGLSQRAEFSVSNNRVFKLFDTQKRFLDRFEVQNGNGDSVGSIKKDADGLWHYYSAQADNAGFYVANSFDMNKYAIGAVEGYSRRAGFTVNGNIVLELFDAAQKTKDVYEVQNKGNITGWIRHVNDKWYFDSNIPDAQGYYARHNFDNSAHKPGETVGYSKAIVFAVVNLPEGTPLPKRVLELFDAERKSKSCYEAQDAQDKVIYRVRMVDGNWYFDLNVTDKDGFYARYGFDFVKHEMKTLVGYSKPLDFNIDGFKAAALFGADKRPLGRIEAQDQEGNIVARINQDAQGVWHYFTNQADSNGYYPAYVYDMDKHTKTLEGYSRRANFKVNGNVVFELFDTNKLPFNRFEVQDNQGNVTHYIYDIRGIGKVIVAKVEPVEG
ncbi:MAG: hypothetical protein NTY47_08940, partial [Candidatus Omnitrophica bacterium]|nr:hypothetical protein [Candidatus Omnitrophota bacterium]